MKKKVMIKLMDTSKKTKNIDQSLKFTWSEVTARVQKSVWKRGNDIMHEACGVSSDHNASPAIQQLIRVMNTRASPMYRLTWSRPENHSEPTAPQRDTLSVFQLRDSQNNHHVKHHVY